MSAEEDVLRKAERTEEQNDLADGSCLTSCNETSRPPNGDKSEEEHVKTKLSLFRATAKKVRRNKALTRVLAQDARRHLKKYAAVEGNEQEVFTFNVQSFFPECQTCSGLSERVKIILTNPSWNRTDEELGIVRRFVMKLACFSRYSLYVRQELAHVLFYEVFESGRVVIRQGDIGFSFYFIVSGSVLVEVQDKDPVSGGVRNNIVGELGAGATFGDLALLNDDKRRATIVCREDCEFLKVDKEDFKKILMESCQENWAHSNGILCRHPLFREWSKDQLRLAVEGSQFVEFTSNSVIIKDFSEPSENLFIVTKGKCKVVQKVALLVSGNGRLKLQQQAMVQQQQRRSTTLPPILPEGHNLVQKPPKRELKKCHKWWLLRTLYPGDYFGVGEGPSNSSVICADIAECLLVNMVVLAKQSQGRYLESVQAEAKLLYPTVEEAFKSYVEGRQWEEYKRRVLDEVVSGLRRYKNSSYRT